MRGGAVKAALKATRESTLEGRKAQESYVPTSV
jgi:hypothetical protein